MAEQCHTAEVSRAGFYRYLHQAKPKKADMLLRARLQELAVAHHRLRGYRMLTALLRREGQLVNRKRVLRLSALTPKMHTPSNGSTLTLSVASPYAKEFTATGP